MLSIESHNTRKTETSEPPGLTGLTRRNVGRFLKRAGSAARLGRQLSFARRPDLPPGTLLAARPALLVLTTVSLVVLCAILASWGSSSHPNPAGFDLRADNSSSKLTNTSAEAPASLSAAPPQTTVAEDQPDSDQRTNRVSLHDGSAPAVNELQHQIAEAAQPLPAQPSEPAAAPLSSQPAELIRLTESATSAPASLEVATPEQSDPLIDWHRGDTPMTRNWKNVIGIEALLAAALATAPALAAAPEDPPKPDKVDKVLEKLKDLDGKLGALETIKRDIASLQAQLNLLQQNTNGEIKDLKDQNAKLEARMKELEAQLKQMTARQAFSPPAPTTGRVRLRNSFTRPARVIINDRSYPLEPNQSADISNLPIGALTYEVIVDGWGVVQARTTVNLTAENPRTIEIYAR
jgi:hypothetical protein